MQKESPEAGHTRAGTGSRAACRLLQAMEKENESRDRSPTERAEERRKIAEFMLKLAIKRGTKLRPATVGSMQPADEEVPGLLLAQNLEHGEVGETNNFEEASSMTEWLDSVAA
jgi:hypothetical protein